MPEETPKPRRRDVRVDRIGFVDALAKAYIDDKEAGLRPKLKASMQAGEIVEGDYFEGQIYEGTSRSADPGVLLHLYAKGRLTRTQLLSALTVKISAVDELGLTLDEQARLFTESASAPRLNIKPKKGVAVGIEAALDGLVAAIRGSQKSE